ncbi:MAG: ImmA/IrrE family metallo-endopeptidase [Chloroflexi bacterium]|nr:MAG: ImmA/IrrE family metallo-endopeptidase [Chloroflexota bacterium]
MAGSSPYQGRGSLRGHPRKVGPAFGIVYKVRPFSITITTPAYRRRASLPRKQEYAIVGQVQEWLERYLEVESLFGEPHRFALPRDLERRVASLDDVERVALALRRRWDLGLGPIESLVEVLEAQGIKVGLVEGHDDFDALTLWANGEIPVIVVKRGLPGDRQRFNLAHELGHLVLETTGEVDAEKAAYRFAGAFLVPAPTARLELGTQRQSLSLYELHLLKHKYGLSMQAWIYRAKDLHILSPAAAERLFRRFRREGWHRREPGDPIPPEEPGRMKRLVLRALAEDLISESRAAELLGTPLERFWHEEARQHDGFPVAVRC